MTDQWVERAKQAFESSTTYVDANYRQQWEEALAHFNGVHAPDSKYHKDAYKYRYKIFRPKTRASVRSNEAACVTAFFSTEDIVNCEPANPNDQMQQASAAIMQEVLNYRLAKTIPWFQTLVGGFQDAQTVGVVCSRQDWEYEEQDVAYEQDAIELDEMGLPTVVTQTITEKEVVKDQPRITLIPVERIRIHPASDWCNPIESSPYVIEQLPMLVQDVRARMSQPDSKTGEPKWNKLEDAQLKEGVIDEDTTRQMREDREDKFKEDAGVDLEDFSQVMVHRNIFRIDGKDVMFYTLGTKHLLSKPVLVKDVYPQGRPYVLGNCVIETHKIFPTGVVGLGGPVQKLMNEVANQRLDNVSLVLNKRFKVRRGSQVDVKALMRNVPGSVVYVNEMADVESEDFNDITSSSYAEQDRLSLDYDEVTGTFSTGSIQSNRKLGETVGGMTMLQGASNLHTEYLLRTFAETWIEPVMRQLVKLESKFESDMVVLSFAAEQAQLFQKYGISQLTDEMLDQELSVTVSVGLGATDPIRKVERFAMSANMYLQMAVANAQLGPMGMNMEEVAKELFGRNGYKNVRRFFPNDQMAAMQQQMQQMAQQMQQLQMQAQAALEDKQAKEQAALQADMQKSMVAEQNKAQIAQGNNRTALMQTQMNNRAAMQQKVIDLLNPVAGERRTG